MQRGIYATRVGRVTLWLAGLLLVASLFTKLPPRSEAPLLAGAQVPSGVRSLLERSCADCHSEATHYPWYSHVAPFSWLIATDVANGRRRLNLSQWSEYPRLRRLRSLSEIANQVKDSDMPLWQYTLIHRKAKLSPADADDIFRWTQTERTRLIEEGVDQEKVP